MSIFLQLFPEARGQLDRKKKVKKNADKVVVAYVQKMLLHEQHVIVSYNCTTNLFNFLFTIFH